MRDEQVKDSARDVAEDVAEGVLGATEDGSLSVSRGKIIITPVACPAAPYPQAPQVSSSAAFSSSRQALFERLKPFVGAAGPVTVAVDS